MKKESSRIKISCIQIDSGECWETNWDRIKTLHLPKAIKYGARIIALPEVFLMRSSEQALNYFPQKAFQQVINETKTICKKHRVAMLLGSMPEKDKKAKGKFFNTSILVSELGKIVTKYQKIHLFDIDMPQQCFVRESKNTSGGSLVKSVKILGVKVGLSICYDLRFPELYRALSRQHCKIAFIPANFTYVTGKAHWEVLLRARAIENQMFVVAPNQSGRNRHTGLKSYGKSMIISPWGDILAKAKGYGEEVLIADLDIKAQQDLCKRFPVLKHRKIT